MNDFTPQELDEIKRCLKYMITGQTTPYSNLTIALNKKLQLIMDNYCEHKRDEECQHEPTHALLLTNPPQHQCLKCGEFYR